MSLLAPPAMRHRAPPDERGFTLVQISLGELVAHHRQLGTEFNCQGGQFSRAALRGDGLYLPVIRIAPHQIKRRCTD